MVTGTQTNAVTDFVCADASSQFQESRFVLIKGASLEHI